MYYLEFMQKPYELNLTTELPVFPNTYLLKISRGFNFHKSEQIKKIEKSQQNLPYLFRTLTSGYLLWWPLLFREIISFIFLRKFNI
jgi:hypothetical protein